MNKRYIVRFNEDRSLYVVVDTHDDSELCSYVYQWCADAEADRLNKHDGVE